MRTTTLQPAGQWAQEEFGFANLGDHRLSKRLVNVATNLAANPGGTLPQAFADWAELKAAYRFFDNRSVDFEKVVQPHLERTRLACREPGEYLMIEDSSTLDFSGHRRTQDLGVIGDGQGGVLSCIVRWRCGWRRGRWSNDRKVSSSVCLTNSVADLARHLWERAAGSD